MGVDDDSYLVRLDFTRAYDGCSTKQRHPHSARAVVWPRLRIAKQISDGLRHQFRA